MKIKKGIKLKKGVKLSKAPYVPVGKSSRRFAQTKSKA